jgi:hypothetical protein
LDEEGQLFQAADGCEGAIDFSRKYRQYFASPRHVSIHGLSEAAEAYRAPPES